MEALIDGALQYSRIGRVQTLLETVAVGTLITEVIPSLAPPPDTIDRSFVSRMGFGDKNSKIVQAIILLAQTLEIEVIAEGIETAEQQVQLTALHCQQGQGYLFSKPLDSATAGALISLCAAGGKRTSFDVQALLQDVQNTAQKA